MLYAIRLARGKAWQVESCCFGFKLLAKVTCQGESVSKLSCFRFQSSSSVRWVSRIFRQRLQTATEHGT